MIRAKITIYDSDTGEVKEQYDAKCLEDAIAQYWSYMRYHKRLHHNNIPCES